MSQVQFRGASHASGSASDRTGLRTLRALVIDDNRNMRQLLRTMLTAYGIRDIHEASDGQSGLAALRDVKPDFVLTDYDMKPVNGVAFVKMVRRSCPPPLAWVPIILITGYTEMRRIQTARDAGVTEVLSKPVTAQSLYDRIVEIIERPRGFINAPEFVGPDRRRRVQSPDYEGPRRRAGDRVADDEFLLD